MPDCRDVEVAGARYKGPSIVALRACGSKGINDHLVPFDTVPGRQGRACARPSNAKGDVPRWAEARGISVDPPPEARARWPQNHRSADRDLPRRKSRDVGAPLGPLARGLEALEAALGYVEMPRTIHVAREGQAQGRLATRHVAMKEQ